MELDDTIELMKSESYKDRFKAEYYQVKIRSEKLHDMLTKYENGSLPFTPTCPINVLRLQENAMQGYLDSLIVRASIENITL